MTLPKRMIGFQISTFKGEGDEVQVAQKQQNPEQALEELYARWEELNELSDSNIIECQMERH